MKVADYQIVEPLEGWEAEAMYVAIPPARLSHFGDRVLLKVVNGLGNERGMRRATDELRIFAAVDSPHVVRLYDAGQDGDQLFYAMGFPALGTLRKPTRALSFEERVAAARDACLGADALHEAGVVHRSITPNRVLIGDGGAQLADLGLARYFATGLVTTTMPDVGEIEYLDPAVLRGAPPTRATDIWSLGAVLHFAASGGKSVYPELPADPLASVRHVLNVSPTVDPGLPAPLADCIRSALDANPAGRPGTARELAQTVDQLREPS
jgi:serine/threonine protein kinase